MKYLTERQRDILQFIKEFQRDKGVAPTHREICDRFGFSSYGTVYKHLSLLEKKGLIRRDWNQKRGVELDPALLVPIAPNEPLLLEQRQVLVHRPVGGKAEAVADLAMRRRHALVALKLLDELENVALPFCEILHLSPRYRLSNVGVNKA